MTTVTQNVIAVAITILVSLFVMATLNRFWSSGNRHNDLIGWQLSILSTTYAVILGFMLFAVWTSLGEAQLNADSEAAAVGNLYRLADGFPETQRARLKVLAHTYADTVIEQEWPQMSHGEIPDRGLAVSDEMWKTVVSVNAASPREVNAQEHAMRELELLTQHRLTRILQSRSRLPKVLWWVLLVGGILTIISACTFGPENIRLQTLQVFSFSLLVSLSLVAIADIHRPFNGLIHVSDFSFQRARQNMHSP